MHTAAVFIDAGYLFRAGADAIVQKTVARRDVALTDPQKLVDVVLERVSGLWDGDPLRLLRTYWYDGARDGVPSPSQIAIGDLPRVKLRLGRVSSGGQKGVDGLIILDLITLARNSAADVAIVMSGDEDVRETLAHVQSFGVTGVVVGFPATPRNRQSVLLLREADHVVTLTASDVEHLFVVAEGAGADDGAGPEVQPPQPSDESQVRRPALNDSDVTESQTARPAAEASMTEATVLPVEAAEKSLRTICHSVVTDPRFVESGVFEPWSGGRMSYRANRVLVARIAELTGVFPVDPAVLSRARQICREIAEEIPPNGSGAPCAEAAGASHQPDSNN